MPVTTTRTNPYNIGSRVAVTFRRAGFVLFVASLALLAWWWTGPAGRSTGPVRVVAAAVDTALFSAFALHHSLLARPSAQRWLGRLLPPELLRPVYVWTASLLLVAMCLAWRPVGGTVYEAAGGVAVALRLLQAGGLLVAGLAVRRISVAELAGLAPPAPDAALVHGGPFRLVRHPIYLGFVLLVLGTPHMTADRLLFAVLSTAWIAVAVPFEEAGLVRQFGDQYRAYRSRVRWRIVPFVY